MVENDDVIHTSVGGLFDEIFGEVDVCLAAEGFGAVASGATVINGNDLQARDTGSTGCRRFRLLLQKHKGIAFLGTGLFGSFLCCDASARIDCYIGKGA